MANKPIHLERKCSPQYFSSFFHSVYSTEWKRYKKYETVDQALQAHSDLLKSSWNRLFEYRLNTPVGIVALPVVKA
jgi:hypothetical protein